MERPHPAGVPISLEPTRFAVSTEAKRTLAEQSLTEKLSRNFAAHPLVRFAELQSVPHQTRGKKQHGADEDANCDEGLFDGGNDCSWKKGESEDLKCEAN
jgi:hypothetical protein